MRCTRCKVALSEGQHYATVDEPYCLDCFVVHYYGFPAWRLDRIHAEMDRRRAAGAAEETLQQQKWATFRRFIEQVLMEKAERFAPFVDRLIAQSEGRDPNAS